MPCLVELQVTSHMKWEIDRGWWLIRGLEQRLGVQADETETTARFFLQSTDDLDDARKGVADHLTDVDANWQKFLQLT